MSFPNFEGKYAHQAFFTAEEHINHLRSTGRLPTFEVPPGLIFCYNNWLMQHIISTEEDVKQVNFFKGQFYLLKSTGNKVGVCGGFGIGAPAVTTILELMVALGVERFISIGAAGGLQKDLQAGAIVVCDKAIRDEGVSHHYLAPALYSYPSCQLTEQLKQQIGKSGARYYEGGSWTIDAPYRETVEEARHYQAQGILTVEMEASALFAVAEVRQVELAAAFVISDSLADLVWNPQFDTGEVRQGLIRLYEVARACLLS